MVFLGPFTRDPVAAPLVDFVTFLVKVTIAVATQLFSTNTTTLAVLYVWQVATGVPACCSLTRDAVLQLCCTFDRNVVAGI